MTWRTLDRQIARDRLCPNNILLEPGCALEITMIESGRKFWIGPFDQAATFWVDDNERPHIRFHVGDV